MRIASFPALVLLLAAAPRAAGQHLQVVDQYRYASATFDADDFITFLSDEDYEAAPDDVPFLADVSVTVNHPEASGTSAADQDSEIGSSLLRSTGHCTSDASISGGLWLAESLGTSSYWLEVSVLVKTSYRVTGSTANTGSPSDSRISLFGPGGYEFQYVGNHPSIDESGVLEPGTYFVVALSEAVTVLGNGNGGPGSASHEMNLELTPLSGTYCTTSPNSVGPGALIAFTGSQDVGTQDFHLQASGSVPGEFGVFYYGPDQIAIPFGDGTRCVGGTVFRLPPRMADLSGSAMRQVQLGGPGAGAILPDSTWNFQWWYRDPQGANAFNLSQAIWVTFCP